jgi:lipoprotein-anchoring transpeptidase ErfK/SrfK
MVSRLLLPLVALTLLGPIAASPTSYAAALDKDAVNGAELPPPADQNVQQDKKGRHKARASRPAAQAKGPAPAVIKAQVLLDRAGVSPGEIDGRLEENTRKALGAYGAAHQLKDDGTLDPDLWAALTGASPDPVLVDYTITEDDVKGPFLKKLPGKMEDMKDLDSLAYTSAREGLAEKFHMSEGLLRELNPGKSFDKADESIVVANVLRDPPAAKVARIEVDKPRRVLRAFGKDGTLLAVFPASIGSAEKPAPSGTYKVTKVAPNPTYRYNPAYAFKGVKAKRPFTIKPGPNNPVGAVWINLSLKGYGIHGTPQPGKVSKTESHGCIRLTNWDVKMLGAMVEKGTAVDFLDRSEDAHTASIAPADQNTQSSGSSAGQRQ